MIILLLSLIGLGVVAGVIGLMSRNDEGEKPVAAETCATCDGSNDKCEQVCMMEAAVKDIVYFEDEELDVFQDRSSDNYSDDEAEQFREVLYTMRPGEVREWSRSLTLRGISLPDQVKDELFILLEDSAS